MSFELNWDAIGAVGELLGSLLVIITLIYLAIQTRSINKQSRADARYAFVESMGDINLSIAQNPQTASIWRRGLSDVTVLSEDERMQFFMFMGQYCNAWSVMYYLNEDGTLPADQWSIVLTDLLSILGSAGGLYFWAYGGRDAFGEQFVAFVDAQLKSSEKTYDMAKLTKIDDEQAEH